MLQDQQPSRRRPKYVPAWMRDRAQQATNARRRLMALGIEKPLSPGTVRFRREINQAIHKLEEQLAIRRQIEPPF